MSDFELLTENSDAIEQKLGYSFKNKSLLALAFIHKSFVNENKTIVSQHNERLEFLGDSVLGVLVSEYLYTNLPKCTEGELSQLKSTIVDAKSCAIYLNDLDVEKYLAMGRGEKLNQQKRARLSIVADLLEAIIGAIYLDGGVESAKSFFFSNFQKFIEMQLKKPLRNFKAELQEYTQRRYQIAPQYRITNEEGPDHHKTFHISVFVDDKELGFGLGYSKKCAEQEAARTAIVQLESILV